MSQLVDGWALRVLRVTGTQVKVGAFNYITLEYEKY